MSDTPPARAGQSVEDIHDDHHAPTIARNARVGLWLFAVYVVLYAGFMVLSAFYPERMRQSAVAGVNLAVAYGFGLIVGAFLLALLYMFLVRGRAADDASAREGR
jgi:uncharacterized membrane protein (DUF485 family)